MVSVPTRPVFVVVISFLVLVIAQWMLFGFNIPGQSDEWVHLARMEYVPFIPEPTIRPLLRLPWAVAYWLTPGSFLGLNLILAVALFVKGLALYSVLRRLLPEYPALAYAAGVLFIVYPADDAAFALYVVGFHVSIAAYLIATYCFLVYQQRPAGLPLAGIWLGLLVSLGIVETAYPLVIATPLLLPGMLSLPEWFRLRRKPTLSELWRAAKPLCVWYAIPLILLAYAEWLILSGSDPFGYQNARFAQDNSLPALLGGLIRAFHWQIWEAWTNALLLIGPVRLTSPHTWVTLGSVAITGGVLWLHKDNKQSTLSPRFYGRLLITGMIVLALGVVLFVLSAFRDSIERTTLFSSIGAVVVIITLMLALTRSPRPIRYGVGIVLLIMALNVLVASQFANRLVPLLMSVVAIGLFVPERWRYTLVIAGLVGISTAHALNRHEKHVARALRQEPILTSLAAAVPEVASNSILLLFDDPDTNEVASAFWERYDVVNNATKYIYNNPGLEAYLCVQDESSGQTSMGQCLLESDRFRVVFAFDSSASFERSYEQVIAVRYSSEGVWQVLKPGEFQLLSGSLPLAYTPEAHMDSTGARPIRLQSIYDHPSLDWRALFKG